MDFVLCAYLAHESESSRLSTCQWDRRPDGITEDPETARLSSRTHEYP